MLVSMLVPMNVHECPIVPKIYAYIILVPNVSMLVPMRVRECPMVPFRCHNPGAHARVSMVPRSTDEAW